MLIRTSLATLALCLLLAAAPARAMQFTTETVGTSELFLVARGPIVRDDAARLEKALGQIPPLTRLLALALDSPGGLVNEGEELANIIRTRKLPVVVAADRQCVSACFLLFAASPRKIVESSALVGVHSASENGAENDATMAKSVQMARIASALGVPAAIVGKMVRTKPGSVEWLTPDDFTSMGAKVYSGDILAATREPATPTGVPPQALPNLPQPNLPVFQSPAPTTAPNVTSFNRAAGFAAGRDSRAEWDRWLTTQQGGFRDGAVLAQLLSGLVPDLALCRGQADAPDVAHGCEAGAQRLAATEPNRRMDPDYAAGWASRPVPELSARAVDTVFTGASFCGRDIVHLTVQLLRRSDDATRRVVVAFGPQATSPGVPNGMFVAQGTFDPGAGTLRMRPAKWASKPGGFNWFGFDGRTGDGGVTFSGPVTDNPDCSRFTLKRTGGPR